MIGQVVSHYKILEKLGEGGMGIVYKAHDTTLERTVALKFLPNYLIRDPIEKERFYHEAKAAASLTHGNIAVVHEIGETAEGQLFIAMEYVEGKTLRELIASKTLTIRQVLDVAIQIGDGLNVAHKKGVIHRDIKPDNIIVDNDGAAKITDFGLAKLKGASKLTKTGSTLGTAAYMSPEQARGEDVDERSDIFSFGVVLYEMLAGKTPFRGEHTAALLYSITNEEPAPLARYNEQVSDELQRIVVKALEKERHERYQHADEFVADLRRERKKLDYARSGYVKAAEATSRSVPVASPSSQRRFVILGGLIAAVLVAVVMIVVFNPFNFRFGTQPSGAGSDQNSIAVMYFENIADPADQDKTARMLTSLLITGLSESKTLKVVSQQRLYDIVKQLGKEDAKSIDKSMASEVAKKAGVRLVATGEVLQVKPSIVLTIEVSEAEGGRILAAEKIAGAGTDDMFSVVDRLTAGITRGLSLAQRAEGEPSKPVADVTSHSPDAYRYYLSGMEYMYKLYYDEAFDQFQKAVALDSTFAMAYYGLALSYGTVPSAKRPFIEKAVHYSDHATTQEREFIQAFATLLRGGNPGNGIRRFQDYISHYPDDKLGHWYVGGLAYTLKDYQLAISELSKVVDLDPYYKLAYNVLAYAYDSKGDFEKSLWAIDKYISLAPEEPNPYDTRGDLYAKHGKLTEAINSYRRALAIKADFIATRAKLVRMFIYAEDYARADSMGRVLAKSSQPGERASGLLASAELLAYQGKLKDAQRYLKSVETRVDSSWPPEVRYRLEYAREWIACASGDYSTAIDAAGQDVRMLQKSNLGAPIFQRPQYIYFLALGGQIAKAEEIAEQLRADILKTGDSSAIGSYWIARGCIEQMKGNVSAARAAFLHGIENKIIYSDPPMRFLLGRIYLDNNEPGEAVSEFEKLATDFLDVSRLYEIGPQLYYYLGLAYERSGSTEKAIAQYETYLRILKNADTSIPEVADAQRRLTNLRKKV